MARNYSQMLPTVFRPELGSSRYKQPFSTDHEYYEKLHSADNVDNIYQHLIQCHERIDLVMQMERKLYDGVISLHKSDETNHTPENKSVIQLESTILDMASTSDLCQGVLYLFPIKVSEKYIVRYIESGCYRGFAKQVGQKLIASELNVHTSNILLWQVYTDTDFQLTQKQKSIRKPLSNKTAFRKRYNQLLSIQNTSIKKQLSVLTKQLPLEYRCLLVHTLKCQANPMREDDSFLYLKQDNAMCSQNWNRNLQEYIQRGN